MSDAAAADVDPADVDPADVDPADVDPADVDTASFRRAAGQFASGIVVVTTRSGHAMTVSAFTSVSLAPPLVLFCAEKIARFHDAVVAAGWWAVCILGEDAEKTARWLATRGRPMDGQLSEVAHHPGPVTGAPVLDDALAVLECRTTAVHDGGDHSIVVGRVAGVSVPSDPPRHGPLVHHAGAYRRLALARRPALAQHLRLGPAPGLSRLSPPRSCPGPSRGPRR